MRTSSITILKAFTQTWENYQQRIETALDQRLSYAEGGADKLHQALRYCSLGGGKRLRGMLVFAVGEQFGVDRSVLDVPACVVELIHAYSLVHDDLPCMDDDDLRRGRPTCHKAFDEATALLAGDAAQSLAFELLADDDALKVSDRQKVALIATLSKAVGVSGMAGGQSLDMDATNQVLGLGAMQKMHEMKTGALIRASCQLGGLCSERITEEQLALLERYGRAIGLAFQVQDDILDATSDTKTLGKTAGVDQKLHKSTYISSMGLQQAKKTCGQLCDEAVELAGLLGDNQGMLENLAKFVGNRSY